MTRKKDQAPSYNAALSGDDTATLLLGDWVQVVSSNVGEVKYEEDKKVFTVGFHDFKRGVLDYYLYDNVPLDLVLAFATAPSKGKFINRYFVKSGWHFTKGVRFA
jgi:hypothetical protein